MKTLKIFTPLLLIALAIGFIVSCNDSSFNNKQSNPVGNSSKEVNAWYLNIFAGQHGNCTQPQAGAYVEVMYISNGQEVKWQGYTNESGWAWLTPSCDYGTYITIRVAYGDYFNIPCPVAPPNGRPVNVYCCLNNMACDCPPFLFSLIQVIQRLC
jgi:hypothetical protein